MARTQPSSSTFETPAAAGWLHDPDERVAVFASGEWEVRVPRRGTPRYRRLRRCDGLHVQLWHPARRVSVLTPCALTGHRFEVRPWDEPPQRIERPPQLHAAVAAVCPTPLPTMRELALFVDWFARAPAPAWRRNDRSERAGTLRLDAGEPGGNRRRSAVRPPRRREPLAACDPATLRQLILFLAVADPAAVDRLAALAPERAVAGRLCPRVVAALAAVLRSNTVRRELDRSLAKRLEDRARRFERLCLSALAEAWRRELRAGSSGTAVVALLWSVARRPEACYRKLEEKIRRHVEESRRWLLLDTDAVESVCPPPVDRGGRCSAE